MIYLIYLIIAILALVFNMQKDTALSNILCAMGIIGVIIMPYILGG